MNMVGGPIWTVSWSVPTGKALKQSQLLLSSESKINKDLCPSLSELNIRLKPNEKCSILERKMLILNPRDLLQPKKSLFEFKYLFSYVSLSSTWVELMSWLTC